MNASLLLRIICLVGVMVSVFLYFQVRNQNLRVETNLVESRLALQEKLEELAALKSRVLNAEETSQTMTRKAEEAQLKTTGYKDQFDELQLRADEAEAARQRSEQEVSKLSASNRDLQRQVNALQASVPPKNWREELNRLQSRLLELEAENTSLKRSLTSSGQPASGSANAFANNTTPSARPTIPVGKVMRMGPDGSFAILSYGRQLGAAEGQTLTLRRDGQTVALVSLTQITNDFSIAQILSSTNTGGSLSVPDIQIGDTAHLE